MAAPSPLEARIEPFRPDASSVQLSGRHFTDEHGRVLDMRGANVGSASKVPIRPCPPLHAHAEATYVGRPFPLDEAREHWRRLRSWGLTFVRLTVTWEAVEHAGPGQYDQAYLDYLRNLIIGMNEEGVAGYVVIHQDVFSRYCGGSGAPGWTVEAAGFDLSDDGDKLSRTGSAFLDGVRGGRIEGERGLWPTGYQKLACATMSTLFWGGDTFAPSLKVKDQNGKEMGIQGYLQDAFLAMVDKVVETVGDLPGVLGFELMNEPHPGYIGSPSINEWNYNTDLHLGAFPTPLQSFSAGSGHPTSVSNWVRTFPFPTRRSGTVLLNPSSLSVWRPDGPTGGECPWEREGVWRWSDKKNRAVPLQSDYFTKDRQGNKVDYYRDFYVPFVKRWDQVVRNRQGGKARFVEGVPNEYCPEWKVGDRPGNMVYAPHWYDLNAMFKKSFGRMTVNVQGLSRGMFILNALYFTRDGAKRNYAKQIGTLVEKAREQLREVPIVFGECGIPMDMNKEEAFKTGNWEWHERMMDALISALESSKVGFNLWSYNPANRDDIGDDWNAENFSWYSNHQRDLALQKTGQTAATNKDLDVGSRLLNVIARPYAVATSGEPIKIEYNYLTTEYTYRFHSPHRPGVVSPTGAPSVEHITEFFLPRVYVTNRAKVRHYLSLGGRVVFDYPNQRAYVWYVDTDRKDPQYTALDGRSTRRFTMWIEGYYQEEGWTLWQRLALLFIFVGGLVLAVYLQSVEWDRDRKLGFEPWKGVNLFKAKWDL